MEVLSILQDYLDRMSQSVLTGDYASYRAGVALPFTLITETASMTVATETELRAGFDGFRSMLQSQGVTDYIRTAKTAVAIDDRMIIGRDLSNMLRGTVQVVPPYHSQITLRRDSADWLAVSISASLQNPRWPVNFPRIATHSQAHEYEHEKDL